MLFTTPFTFGKRETTLDKAKYAIVGVPFDASESYRVGSRYAPIAIREASRELEDYDILEEYDLTKIRICDVGDVEISYGYFEETSKRVTATIKEILENKVIPVVLGGEHTITYSVLKAYENKELRVVIFDAHLDFRKEYLGNRFSHACVIRRIGEIVGYENILVVGVRSALREEHEEARDKGVKILKANEFDPSEVVKHVKDKEVYISIDFDVFDPKEAPGVCNPEPQGLSFKEVVDSMEFLKYCKLSGFDVVEITPLYDSYTQVLAAKLIFKILSKNDKAWEHTR